MSQTRTRERTPAPQMTNPFGIGGDIAPLDGEAASLPALMPAAGGGRATDNALAGVITAQRVAVKRDLGGILAEAKALGATAGDDFYYSIPYKQKDKDTGDFKTVYVEGPSIKAAMACASLYGNCRVGAHVGKETATHWFFSAIFQDLEKGVTVIREFQAQKPQEGRGRMDTARRADMDFQSAQSKAIRNVVVAAIPLVVEAAYQSAKHSILDRVTKMGREKALEHILNIIDELHIPIARVERKMATPAEEWTPKQIVRVIMDARAIRDGVLGVEEVWPSAPGDTQTPQQQAETVVTEAAAAEAGEDPGDQQESDAAGAPMPAATEAAEGRGQAGEEVRAGGSSAAADAPERPHDPPPPAAEQPKAPPAAAAAAAKPAAATKPKAAEPAKPASTGLNFD